MKRCSDPKNELVFPQLVRGLRNLLENCFRDDVKGTFLHSSCCCLHISPTDANAFRLHRLTTQKGTHCKKNQKETKGPRKVNTHAIIGKEKKRKQKNKAPDSQTSQATCQTKEIDRAHRSHSTREAKQNKTNKKNQGSPIKTIKPHDSIVVPLLGRGVFTAGFAPARPFPTPTYKCVGNSRSRKSRFGLDRECPRDRAHGGGDCHSDESNCKR